MRLEQEIKTQWELIKNHQYGTFLVNDCKQTYHDIKSLPGRITKFAKSNADAISHNLLSGAVVFALGYLANEISHALPLKRSNYEIIQENHILDNRNLHLEKENLGLRYENEDLKQDLEKMIKKYVLPELMPEIEREKIPDLKQEAPKYQEPQEEHQRPREKIIEAKEMGIV